MFSKNCFFVLIASFFVAGLIFFALPDTAFSQTGCCINSGNQCVGNGSAACGMVEEQNSCDGSPGGSFTPGLFCCQTPGQAASCEPSGCCLVGEFECTQTPETACDNLDGTYLGDGACLPTHADQCTPPLQTGCCETTEPTACENNVTAGECGDGTFMVNTSCDGDVCGEAPPPVDGCCQNERTSCKDTTDQECPDAPFFPGGMCMIDGDSSFCEPSALGCCVFGPNDCDITTAQQCTGEYQGDATSCNDVSACNISVVTAVPTIGEWGLIAMAGLLGLFSLFIIVRRDRYNIN